MKRHTVYAHGERIDPKCAGRTIESVGEVRVRNKIVGASLMADAAKIFEVVVGERIFLLLRETDYPLSGKQIGTAFDPVEKTITVSKISKHITMPYNQDQAGVFKASRYDSSCFYPSPGSEAGRSSTHPQSNEVNASSRSTRRNSTEIDGVQEA